MARATNSSKDVNIPANVLDAGACVFRHIARTSRAVTSTYDAAFAPFDLTAGQFDLMMTLHHSGPRPVGELAKLTALDASTVPRAIRPLVEKALLAVRQGEDRRQRIVSLTPAGRKRAMRAATAWERRQRAVVKEFGEENWTAMMHDLSRLRTVVRQKKTNSAERNRASDER
jgi:DNA-binding MarR family transcriptional regulator